MNTMTLHPPQPRSAESEPTAERLDALLAESRHLLLAFIEGQGVAPAHAEDVLQHSLLKALRAAPDLRDDERLIPWFYRIVRNAVHDTHRRRARERRAMTDYAAEHDPAVSPREAALLCFCFRALLPTLKPEYRVLIEEIELEGRDPEDVARRLGITRNNLNVRRHRARQQLRERLEALCTACPDDDPTDCACPSNPAP
jgi:RNA polymerase sigma-70 factor (ECF subfamily)